MVCFFFFQAEDGIRDGRVTGVQTCALPISRDIRKEEVRQATLRVLVAEAMDWLPTSQRHVFELRAVQGISAQVVAERLETSPTEVDSLMRRTMQIGRASCRERV